MKYSLIIISLLELTSCQYSYQLKSDQELTNRIVEEVRKNPDSINLSEISDFKWDHLLILEPYSRITETGIKLNLDLSNIDDHSIRQIDHYNLLVFINENKSVMIVELPRSEGDFKTTKKLIPKVKSKFFKTGNEIVNKE